MKVETMLLTSFAISSFFTLAFSIQESQGTFLQSEWSTLLSTSPSIQSLLADLDSNTDDALNENTEISLENITVLSRHQKPVCEIQGKCFDYRIKYHTGEAYSKPCVLTNVFHDPIPKDNYVSGGNNLPGLIPPLKSIVTGGKLTSPEIKQWHWGEESKRTTFRSTGAFSVQYFSSDYSHTSTCEANVMIQSSNRPISTYGIPFSNRRGSYMAYFSQRHFKALMTNHNDFYKWYAGRLSDPCSKYDACDKYGIYSKQFGELNYTQSLSQQEVSMFYKNTSKEFYPITSREKKFLKTHVKDNLLKHLEPGAPSLCTKCLYMAHGFFEKVPDGFSCNNNSSDDNNVVETTTCRGGKERLSLFQCVRATGWTLFRAWTDINPQCKEQRGYNDDSTEIYVSSKWQRVSDMLKPIVVVAPEARRLGLISIPEAQEMVKFRYRFVKRYSRWEALDRFTRWKRVKSGDVLHVEAWSACGSLHSIRYTIKCHGPEC